MGHRIREAMRAGDLAPMGGGGGIVEIDETVQGRKRRGQAQGPRARVKSGGMAFALFNTVLLRSWSAAAPCAAITWTAPALPTLCRSSSANVPRGARDDRQRQLVQVHEPRRCLREPRPRGPQRGRICPLRARQAPITPIQSRAISACSSAACAAPTSIARKSTCTATWRSSTSSYNNRSALGVEDIEHSKLSLAHKVSG